MPVALIHSTNRHALSDHALTVWARIAPGATPSFFGEFAWGAARMFAETAVKLGGRLTRQNLLAAVARISNYTANGLFSPQSIGTKQTSRCQSVIQLVNGKWVRRGTYPYICGSLVNTAQVNAERRRRRGSPAPGRCRRSG